MTQEVPEQYRFQERIESPHVRKNILELSPSELDNARSVLRDYLYKGGLSPSEEFDIKTMVGLMDCLMGTEPRFQEYIDQDKDEFLGYDE